MWLERTNLHTRVTKAEPAEKTWLSEYLAFDDERAKFAYGRRRAQGDGRVRLYNQLTDAFPSGLLPIVKKGAAECGITIELLDRRARPCQEDPTADLSWLHDYQLDAVKRAASAGHGILWIPTAGGKTEIAIALSLLMPTRWLFLVPNVDLLEQTAARYEKRTGRKAGRVGDGEWSEERFTVATFQTVARALASLESGVVARATKLVGGALGLIIDECFPAGTRVGGVRIEEICVGDSVPSFDPVTQIRSMRRVSRLWVRRPSALVRIILDGGRRAITCTPNHRFWTTSGWVPAGELTGGVNVLCLSHEEAVSMRTVRSTGAGRDDAPCGWSEPLREAQGAGRAAGRATSWNRVDSVEVLESGGDGTFGGVCPDGLVYNLEVEGEHTYFAEGLGVSNCHVLPADSFWRVAMKASSAYFRIGMSGTPLARGDKRSLLAVAATGPVIFRLKPDVLIERGVIARPRIRMLPCMQASGFTPTWNDAYRDLVVNSVPRNRLVVEATRRAAKPALVFVKEVDHGRLLAVALNKAGVRTEFVFGADDTDERRAATARLERGELDALIASVVFQQGVDIPSLASVIVAAGGKSTIASLQRIGRGMRTDGGKKAEFEVYDILDRGNKWLEKHAKARQRAFLKEGHEVVVESAATGQVTILGANGSAIGQ